MDSRQSAIQEACILIAKEFDNKCFELLIRNGADKSFSKDKDANKIKEWLDENGMQLVDNSPAFQFRQIILKQNGIEIDRIIIYNSIK